MSDLSTRSSSFNLHHNSSASMYAPIISSPLASSCQPTPSSPLSSKYSTNMFQLIPSSPSSQSIIPFCEMDESEVEMPPYECDMMNIGDDEASKIGLFDLPGSSSPVSMINRRVNSNPQFNHERSRNWKKPGLKTSPRSSTFGDTPMSSPTPLSRAYVSKANQSNRSPSELRQQAANKLRSIERKNRSNAHRPLLDAFAMGTRRGLDDIASNREEMMAEAIGRRHIRHMNRQWEELLSSQVCATDELIEEAEENNISIEEESLDIEIDPSQIYAEYEMQDVNLDANASMDDSTVSTIQQENCTETLLSTLLAPPSICPACSNNGLRCSKIIPPGIECPDCNWTLNASTLQSVDNHFHQHGDRAFHQPVVGYNPHIGTNFVCSNSQCDEMVCV